MGIPGDLRQVTMMKQAIQDGRGGCDFTEGVLGTLFNCSPILNDPHQCGTFSYQSLSSIRSAAGEMGTGSFSAFRKGALYHLLL
jgi:hypothetical protein